MKAMRAKKASEESPEERIARLKKESERKAASRASAALAEDPGKKKERLAEEARRRSEQRSKIPIEFKDHIKNSDVNLNLAAALHKPFRGIFHLIFTYQRSNLLTILFIFLF
jgi:hypothetical protein